MTLSQHLSTIEDIIAEARAGRMFILVDDEDRENEGDLVVPAECAGPEVINFMAKHGRGLICLALTADRVADLKLPEMAPAGNRTRLQTAFTVSIEAREGITTGISAADRAHTIAIAIDPSRGPDDIVSPGHVFPLCARDGGVLVRAGHTEAAVDIPRLAGMYPAGVICEIMNDDGTMARLPDLIPFARQHGLKIAKIADLIAYRRRTEKLVKRALVSELATRHGGTWTLYLYTTDHTYAEHVALVKGDFGANGPVPVRMHALSLLDDVLGDTSAGRDSQLHLAMSRIAEVGRGVVVLLREPNATALSETLRARLARSSQPASLRDYGVGAQILLDLGVRDMILLSNHARTIVGLDGYGLRVVDRWAITEDAEGPTETEK